MCDIVAAWCNIALHHYLVTFTDTLHRIITVITNDLLPSGLVAESVEER